MAEAKRSEEGVGFLGRTRRAPSPPARGVRERCKLPQWGPWRSPGRNRFRCISKLVEGKKVNLVTNSRSVFVSNFPLKFRGCSNTQNTPLVTALVATILLLGEQRHNGCEQFSDSVAAAI